MRRILSPRTVGIALLLLTVVAAGVGYHKLLRWKRFDVVEPGVLYRSGILKDWQLRAAIKRYKLKTVFSFTHTNNDGEQRVCDELGVRRVYCYLHGNGVGPDDPYLRFLEIVQDPANHPVLVHCSAGVQRTGGAVALYRVFFNDWSLDDAVDEMVAKGNEGKLEQINQLFRIQKTLSKSTVAVAADRRQRWR